MCSKIAADTKLFACFLVILLQITLCGCSYPTTAPKTVNQTYVPLYAQGTTTPRDTENFQKQEAFCHLSTKGVAADYYICLGQFRNHTQTANTDERLSSALPTTAYPTPNDQMPVQRTAPEKISGVPSNNLPQGFTIESLTPLIKKLTAAGLQNGAIIGFKCYYDNKQEFYGCFEEKWTTAMIEEFGEDVFVEILCRNPDILQEIPIMTPSFQRSILEYVKCR